MHRPLSKIVLSLLPILVVLTLAVPAFSRTFSNLAYNGAGAKLSLVFPDEPNMGIGLGGHLLFGFDLNRAGALALYPNVEFWYASRHHYHYYAPNGYYDLAIWEFCLFLDTRYYFPVVSSVPVKPYAGLGMGPVFTSVRSDPEVYP